MPEVKLNLDTLQGGAARELFEIESRTMQEGAQYDEAANA